MEYDFDPMINEYKKLFNKNGVSPASLGCPKGRLNLRYKSVSRYLNNSKTLLDYGCGFGDLYGYLLSENLSLSYYGIDVIDEFIAQARIKYPNGNFKLVKPLENLDIKVDSICSLGTFNYLYSENEKQHFLLIKKIIKQLWSNINVNLILDFQSEFVDFKQPKAYHQKLDILLNFVNKEISRRYVVDYSYMPYEFNICIFKDFEIIRPKNVYKNN